MAIRVITPPSGGLIALSDAKRQCRVDHDDDDDLITDLILVAGAMVESFAQRRYLTQTLEWVCEGWTSRMALPVAPGGGPANGQIVSVTYVDLQSEMQTLDPSLYWDRPLGQTRALVRRWYSVWPLLGDGAERVVVRFSITGAQADVPPNVRHAVRLLVSHFYENRDAVVGIGGRDSPAEMPLGYAQLLTEELWDIC